MRKKRKDNRRKTGREGNTDPNKTGAQVLRDKDKMLVPSVTTDP